VDEVRPQEEGAPVVSSGFTQYDFIQLAIIASCLTLSAFFAGAETAVTSLGSLKAKQILETEKRGVKSLTLWLNHPNRVLTTILIFNSTVHIFASAVATDFTARHLESQSIGIATGIMTLLVLVFGEITPKSYAKTHADKLALPMLRFIYLVQVVFFPLVWGLSELSSKIVKSLGGEKKDTPPITEAELEYLVGVGERAGVLEETKKDMITGVFEFDETKVREIKTPRPDIKYLGADANFDEALNMAIESGMSRIPVCDDSGIDHIVGILLVKDLLRVARANHPDEFQLKAVMREPFFIPESKLIMDVFKELKSSKNHIAIVIDEHGGTAGLVTMEDILEEIVGEIQDEYDVEEAEILELDDGVFDVAGSTNIDEFLEYFGIDEKELQEERDDDIDTIAGWITSLLGELPEVGKTVRIGPLNVEVSEVERNRVLRVRVSRILGGDKAAAEDGG
jgi:CBS domain containing-hemolysin-like protein